MRRSQINGLLRRISWQTVFVATGVILIALTLGAIIWFVPQWQIPTEVTAAKDRAALENEARRTIAQIILGILVLVGVSTNTAVLFRQGCGQLHCA